MSIPFPSPAFFQTLQEGMDREPGCTEPLDPCEAYCGLAIDEQLYVLEFDGRKCAAFVMGGNELDLDFVVAGPASAWQQIIERMAVVSFRQRSTNSWKFVVNTGSKPCVDAATRTGSVISGSSSTTISSRRDFSMSGVLICSQAGSVIFPGLLAAADGPCDPIRPLSGLVVRPF